MMLSGALNGAGEWTSAHSMAQAIETAMLAAGLLDVAGETADAALQRRKTFVAMATGIVTYLKAHMDLSLPAGSLRATSDVGNAVPPAAKVLTGVVS